MLSIFIGPHFWLKMAHPYPFLRRNIPLSFWWCVYRSIWSYSRSPWWWWEYTLFSTIYISWRCSCHTTLILKIFIDMTTRCKYNANCSDIYIVLKSNNNVGLGKNAHWTVCDYGQPLAHWYISHILSARSINIHPRGITLPCIIVRAIFERNFHYTI